MAPHVLPPGFRFHPTDEELVGYYLDRKINGRTIELEIIPVVDLYKCEPWDLPGKSFLPSKDMEWYFFTHRDRKYPNGSRTNRATKAGYWKATGKDRIVESHKRPIGMKKTLVYYKGRAPNGIRTNWVMHEYRLMDSECEPATSLKDVFSLCRIFKKNIFKNKIEEQPDEIVGGESSWAADHEHLLGDDETSSRSIAMMCRTEFGEENYERDERKFPSDTCSSDITQGSAFDNGIAYHLHTHFTGIDEVNSSTNVSPLRLDPSAFNPIKDIKIPNYSSVAQELDDYSPLAMEDFPQIDTIETKIQNTRNIDERYTLWRVFTSREELYNCSLATCFLLVEIEN
ncbi:hypothetical protein ACLOJK_029838 [Asimina triloba]